MTKIKLCGLRTQEDVRAANAAVPDYIGFVFAEKSRRAVTAEQAEALRLLLKKDIAAVGVFVNAPPEQVAELLNRGVIDMAQLHGTEDAAYVKRLRMLTNKPLIQAFRILTQEDAKRAQESTADAVLLDAGAGCGKTFDWHIAALVKRSYFLAGGLDADNVCAAIGQLHPYAVDVSSGIETNGVKDAEKMRRFVSAVRQFEEEKQ